MGILLDLRNSQFTSVPFSCEVAVPLSVDEKEVALVPNPVPDLAVKTPRGPQMEEDVDLCTRVHSLLPFTLQMVIPFLSPVTLHLKVKVSSGQVGGAAVSCPATSNKNGVSIVVHPGKRDI